MQPGKLYEYCEILTYIWNAATISYEPCAGDGEYDEDKSGLPDGDPAVEEEEWDNPNRGEEADDEALCLKPPPEGAGNS